MFARYSRWGWLISVGMGVFWANCASAQMITSDKTLPNNSSITRDGNTFNINGGTTVGRNLFHSFSEFSVPTGGTALFNNALDIQNIISRVTGTSVSNIDGLIRANGTANLFVINPNGIIFGSNARLDIRGSFIASTASSLKFADGFAFDVTAPQGTPLLTISVPIGLQYGSNPGSIRMASHATSNTGETVGLQVQAEKTLALVGGGITVDGGYLTAPNGRIELGSVAGNSLVRLTPTLTGYTLGYEDAKGFQDILLQNSAKVSNVNTNSNRDDGIQVQGANVTLTNGSSIQMVNLLGSGTGTNLSVNADHLVLTGTGSQLLTQTESSATGDAGDVKINTNEFRIEAGAQVLSDTLGAGKSGNVSVNATNLVQLTGTGSRLLAQTEGNTIGNAGDVSITTGVLQVQKGAEISATTLGAGLGGSLNISATEFYVQDGARVFSDTGGTGLGGRLNVNAANLVQLTGTGSSLLTQTESNGKGNAGDVSITTGVLQVQNGARVLSDTLGAGTGGNISVKAANLVQLTGTGSRLWTQSESSAKGNAGDVNITTDVLQLQNGAQVLSDTLGVGKGGNISVNAAKSVQLNGTSSQLLAQTESSAKGNAGDISITTPVLQVQNGAQVSALTLGAGKAGNITVNATDTVQLSDRSADSEVASGLFAETERNATGDAGNLSIKTPVLLIENGAQVSVGTLGAGNAGNVNVIATKLVQLSGRSKDNRFASGLFAQTESNATGAAGDVSITTPVLRVENGAQVSAGTLGAPRAGSININATDTVQLSGRSSGLFAQTDALNATGDAGNLSITTPTLLVENGAQVSVNNTGTGRAGDINITAGSVRLDKGNITAQTSSGNGGNLMLNMSKLLLLRNNSQISTTAGTAEKGGNGGNITIKTPFLVAVPLENSDITANAFNGSGGLVKINALGVYNFNQRSLEDLEKLLETNDPSKLNPQQLTTNDITAISVTSPALSGIVQINTPDLDPSRGLVKLPIVVVDIPRLTASNCAAFADEGGSKFIVTGRGGLPPSPDEPLSTDVVWSDTRLPTTTTPQHSSKKTPAKPPSKPEPLVIRPAIGWVFNGKGEVTLISSTSNATTLGSTPATCPAR